MTAPHDDSGPGGDDTRWARLVPEPVAGVDLSRLRLDPLSGRLLDLIDGWRTLGDLAREVGQDLDTVMRVVWLLGRAGAVFPPEGMPDMTRPAPATEERLPAERTPPEPAPQQPAVRSADAPTAEPGRQPARAPSPEGQWHVATKGDLKKSPGSQVVEKAQATAFSGAIRFERGGKTIALYFEGGQPMGAEGTAADHDLGSMLKAAGRIREPVLEAYRKALAAGAASPVIALRDAGIADRRALADHVAWYGRELLKEVLEWKDGSFAATPGEPVPSRVPRLRIGLPKAVAASWRKAPFGEAQEAMLEKNASFYLVATPAATQIAAGMGLDPKEAAYVKNVIAKPIQLRRALTISTLFRATTRRILAHLISAGALQIAQTNPEGVTEMPLDEIEAYASRLEAANHFDVLTCHPVSSTTEIKERYEKRLTEFAPERYPGAGPQHLAALARIRDRLGRAFAVLSDAEERRRYRNATYGKEQLDSFVDLQLRKAEVALHMRQKPSEALPFAESAVDVDPDSAQARLMLAETLYAMGRTSEARRHLASVAVVPQALKESFLALKSRIG